MECIGGLLLFVAFVAVIATVVWCCLRWTLGPLDDAAKNRQFPIQFSLADLLCLFVLVQLPIGVVHWLARDIATSPTVIVLDVVLCAVAALVWWVCVRMLSRAGIHVVWHRCVILTIVLPGAVLGSIAFLALPAAAIGLLVERHVYAGVFGIFAEMLVVGVLYGLGRFTRAIVASSKEV